MPPRTPNSASAWARSSHGSWWVSVAVGGDDGSEAVEPAEVVRALHGRTLTAARGGVGAQLDDVAVGVADVQPPPDAAGAEHLEGTTDDVEAAARGELVEVGVLDLQGDVIDVLAAALELEQVEDRALGDAHRDERRLAALPLLETDRLQPEQVATTPASARRR